MDSISLIYKVCLIIGAIANLFMAASLFAGQKQYKKYIFYLRARRIAVRDTIIYAIELILCWTVAMIWKQASFYTSLPFLIFFGIFLVALVLLFPTAIRYFTPIETIGGIGLTVARSIARRLGGDVILDTSYNFGARFVFSLPRENVQ